MAVAPIPEEMVVHLAQSLLGVDTDLNLLHRRVVRVGAAASWLVAALFLIGGLLTGREQFLVEALGPVLAAGLMTAQILMRRENGGIALFGSAIVVIAMYAVVGTAQTLVPASLALVVICALATLLIETRQVAVMGVLGGLLLVTPSFWGLPVIQSLQLGTVMTVAYAMTAVVFLTIRNSATGLQNRFQVLFESSPTALLEEDWSESLAYLRSEYTGREDRLVPFLLAYPAVVHRAVSLSQITRVNRAALDLLEADDPEDLLGYRQPEVVDADTMEAFVDALATLFEGKTSYEHDLVTSTMTGRTVWLQIRAQDTSTERAASTVLVGLADVTHMKARQQAMADLVRAKDEFIAKVSHELRTPLTAVVGLTSELVANEPVEADERQELMRLVAGQAQEMSYIVEDLLVASRADMGTVLIEPKLVDLEHELRSVLTGVGLEVGELPRALPGAMADPTRVRQILRNLLTNASRYGGPQRRIVAGALFDKAWIEVRDNGEGVPADMVTRIFEPYGTAHVGVEGSVGLGLSVSRQLAELMGGSLTYHHDGVESVFRLELPLARAVSVASQNASV